MATSSPKSHRLAQQDQAAAVLRDAGRPLTSREVSERMGGYMCTFPNLPEVSHARSDLFIWHECSGAVCFVATKHGVIEKRELERLVFAGLLRRSKDARGRLLWEWIGQPLQLDVAELEAALNDGADQ